MKVIDSSKAAGIGANWVHITVILCQLATCVRWNPLTRALRDHNMTARRRLPPLSNPSKQKLCTRTRHTYNINSFPVTKRCTKIFIHHMIYPFDQVESSVARVARPQHDCTEEAPATL